jgi:hypothetical protein
MDLISLIQAIQATPIVGPFVVYLPPLVLLGAALAAVLPAPGVNAGGWYRVLYETVQWCAINKGCAANAVQPRPKQGGSPPVPPSVSSILGVLMLGAVLALTACTTPQTARQGIYQAAGTYDAALKTATAYARLPRCGQPASPPVCSDQTLVSQASDAASTALPAVNAAIDTAADTQASQSVLAQAQVAAVNAAAAFTAIVVKIGSN